MLKHKMVMILLTLLLSGCSIAYSRSFSEPVNIIPPGEPGGPPMNTPESGGVKVVEMVTATPTPYENPAKTAVARVTPTRTPNKELPLPPTLAGLGIASATYRDNPGGIEFDYPEGWSITDLSDSQKQNAFAYSISLRSSAPKPSAPKQQENFQPGMTAVDVTILRDGPKTLEEAIAGRRYTALHPESGQPVTITQEEDWNLPGGLAAHRLLMNLGPDSPNGPDRMVSEMVTVINNQTVLVSGFGDISQVSAISISLRAVKP